ncbi:hypothetical protein [Serratia quinivorans]|uniref:hypothetical protein n=1 Tax=Serratia quinivorans TaxID=137545 RepID=UPI002E7A2631|nr:hypothetical protein [Serratia quinivorans]
MKKKFQINYFRKFVFSAEGRNFAMPLCKAITCRKKLAVPLLRQAAGISPDFYTEIGGPPDKIAKPAAIGSPGNPCWLFAVFFELDLKINISLFTNYEINVLV